jgi:very-short-patch-repair endonuclease
MMVYINYDGPRRVSKARELRRTQTNAERTLWEQVRNKRLGGFKIRRQHVLNEIIVDFYCVDKRLCIEIDGPYHDEQAVQELDKQRDDDLKAHGFSVLRFKNDEVLFDLERVLSDLLFTLQDLQSSGRGPLRQTHSPNFQFVPEDPTESDL